MSNDTSTAKKPALDRADQRVEHYDGIGGAIDPVDLRTAAQHRKGAGAGDFTIGAEPGSGGVLPIGNRDGCAARWHDQ